MIISIQLQFSNDINYLCFLDECSQGLINLSIAGIATPYVHNSTTMIGVCKMN